LPLPFSSSAAVQPSRVVSAIATRQLDFNSPFSSRLPLSQPFLYLLFRPSSRSSQVLGPLLSTIADYKSLEGYHEISDTIVLSRTDVVAHGPVIGIVGPPFQRLLIDVAQQHGSSMSTIYNIATMYSPLDVNLYARMWPTGLHTLIKHDTRY
jgi:hypothetical protein